MTGWPHWFQTALGGLELALSALLFLLAEAAEKAARPAGTGLGAEA